MQGFAVNEKRRPKTKKRSFTPARAFHVFALALQKFVSPISAAARHNVEILAAFLGFALALQKFLQALQKFLNAL